VRGQLGHDVTMPNPEHIPVRYLWVVRHGKAASDAPWGGTDRERPLTARGRRDATALGRRLTDDPPILGLEGVPAPDMAICSAAVRTRQTAELIVKATGDRLPLDAYRSLYEADTDVVLQYLREIDEGVISLLLVGHNPTMFDLAWALLGDPGDGTEGGGSGAVDDAEGRPVGRVGGLRPNPGGRDDRSILEAHGFPTCALAVLKLDITAWEDIVHGCGTLAGVFKPPY
jgi:phosphohistidine phosphatase